MVIRIASAPVSFGVDEGFAGDAWMPEPEQVLDLMTAIGYEGTELGPPGYLGSGPEVCERLSTRGLALVGSFLPLRLTDEAAAREDRDALRGTLAMLREATPSGSTPFAVLCDAFDDARRIALAGRIAGHPEAWLSASAFKLLVANLHRAAELCRGAGFEPVLHSHAGSHVETETEIRRVADRLDGSLLGLCLDTGHARFGGADPPSLARDYRTLIRHVHVKDCRAAVIDEVGARGGSLPEMVAGGLFAELGSGDARVAETIAVLRETGYSGWLVIEQDRTLRTTDTLETLRDAQARNVETLRALLV